jgi:hypothetical protein
MGVLSDLRQANKATDFAFNAGKRGGSFETSCSPEQILTWFRETKVRVLEESPGMLSASPIHKDGNAGPEIIFIQALPGNRLPTRTVIKVQLNTKPGENNPAILNNPMTIPPVVGLMLKVGKVDRGWQVV